MTMPVDLSRLDAPWLTAPHVRAVIAALQAGGARVWFVGGSVRNALIGAAASDIDMTTDARPEATMRLLQAAGLKAVPTGIAHGTITAVANGHGIEVTTLRADVDTDGRRATVAFTNDLAEDAARRDFTMNALYADPDGRVIDPLGGLPDLAARHVRFIGAPQDRIREDYLRILRFFRFHAWYGDPAGGIDADGLAACAELAGGIGRLSRERVGSEMKKLLSAPDPAPSIASMAACGVLLHAAPGANPAALAPLVDIETRAGVAPDWRRRTAAMMGGDGAACTALTKSWRLPKSAARALDALCAALSTPAPCAIQAYLHGAAAARDAALISACATGTIPTDLDGQIARGTAARFPVSARDLMHAGHVPGPALGAALADLKAAWIASDLRAGRETLLAAAPPPA
jgi:poly(A) polymerase